MLCMGTNVFQGSYNVWRAVLSGLACSWDLCERFLASAKWCFWLFACFSIVKAVFSHFFDFCLFADLVWRVVYEERGLKLDVECVWSVFLQFCALLAPLRLFCVCCKWTVTLFACFPLTIPWFLRFFRCLLVSRLLLTLCKWGKLLQMCLCMCWGCVEHKTSKFEFKNSKITASSNGWLWHWQCKNLFFAICACFQASVDVV